MVQSSLIEAASPEKIMRRCTLAALILFLLATPSQAQSPEAEALVSEGIARRDEGRWEEALSRFREAWNRYQSARALAQIGACELSLSRFADAERDLSMALQLRGDPYIETRRAVLQHDLDQARLRRAAEEAPVVAPAPPAATPPVVTPAPVVIHSPPHSVAPAASNGSSLRTAGVVLLASGGVTAAIGIGAYLLGRAPADEYNNSVRNINGLCRGNDVLYEPNYDCDVDRSRARVAQAFSVGGYIAAGVLGTLGVIFLIAAPSSSAPTARPNVRLGPGPGMLGLSLDATF